MITAVSNEVTLTVACDECQREWMCVRLPQARLHLLNELVAETVAEARTCGWVCADATVGASALCPQCVEDGKYLTDRYGNSSEDQS